MWPLKLVTKLYQHAQARVGQHASLSLHTQTPVTAITHDMTGSTFAYSVVTNRGSISCSKVIHATNAYTSHLLPFLAGPEGIIPTRGQVMATRASVGTDQIQTNGWDGNEVSNSILVYISHDQLFFRDLNIGSPDQCRATLKNHSLLSVEVGKLQDPLTSYMWTAILKHTLSSGKHFASFCHLCSKVNMTRTRSLRWNG